MIKKLFLSLFVIVLLAIPTLVSAQEPVVNIYFFWSKTCPHCAKEKVFLQKITSEYQNVILNDFEISIIKNTQFLNKIGQVMDIETSGVPITIIGNSHFIGYYSDEVTGEIIQELIDKTIFEGDPDPVGKIIRGDPVITVVKPTLSMPEPIITSQTGKINNIEKSVESNSSENTPEKLNIPLFGEISIKNLSLPALTIVVALLDGFNPCAMWTLLFLISLLLGMQDRKRMWILGTAFIGTSAFVYFLFLSAWLNLFLFLGFIIWVRIIIGFVALIAGGYNLRDYFINKSGGCNVMGDQKRQRIFDQIKAVTQKKQFFLALGGIILLAFAVNLVELICSAGLPAIYTQILSLAKLPTWQYYLYLMLYILIFMLDDLIIFFTAMITLQAVGIQSKYARFSHLVGGIIMLIIGILMLFKPEILMFG